MVTSADGGFQSSCAGVCSRGMQVPMESGRSRSCLMSAPHLLLRTSGMSSTCSTMPLVFKNSRSRGMRFSTRAPDRPPQRGCRWHPPDAGRAEPPTAASRPYGQPGTWVSGMPEARAQSSYQTRVGQTPVTLWKARCGTPQERTGNRIGIALRYACVDEADGLARRGRRVCAVPMGRRRTGRSASCQGQATAVKKGGGSRLVREFA